MGQFKKKNSLILFALIFVLLLGGAFAWYTDDPLNSKATALRIYSDSKNANCDPLGNCTTLIKLENISGVTQTFVVDALFPKTAGVTIANVAEQKTTKITKTMATYLPCTLKAQTPEGDKNGMRYICEEDKSYSATNTKRNYQSTTEYETTEITYVPMTGGQTKITPTNNLGLYDESKYEISKRITAYQSVGINAGEIKIIQINFKVPQKSKGEFLITTDKTNSFLDPWWDAGWWYDVNVTITNNFYMGGRAWDLDKNFRVAITMDTATPIAAGKMNADCSDIRVYDENTGNLLNFAVLPSKCDNANTEIVFELDRTIKIGQVDNNIFIYYGNPAATTMSDVNEFYLTDFGANPIANFDYITNGGSASFTYRYGTNGNSGAVIATIATSGASSVFLVLVPMSNQDFNLRKNILDKGKTLYVTYTYNAYGVESSSWYPAGLTITSGDGIVDGSTIEPYNGFSCASTNQYLNFDTGTCGGYFDANRIMKIDYNGSGGYDLNTIDYDSNTVRYQKADWANFSDYIPTIWGRSGTITHQVVTIYQPKIFSVIQPTTTISAEQLSPATYHNITFNIYEQGTTTHLSNFNMDCNINSYDGDFNSPKSIIMHSGNYACKFTRIGYDANGNGTTTYLIQADANKTYTIYLLQSPQVNASYTNLKNVSARTYTLTNTSTATNVTINDWNWTINSVIKSTDQNYVYTYYQNTDYNICLFAGGLGTDGKNYLDGDCNKYYNDSTFPTIDGNIIFTQGFSQSSQATINLRCSDSSAGDINFNIIKNDTNYLLDANGGNPETKSITIGVPYGITNITLSCLDEAGNKSTLDLNSFYFTLVRLVNEENGVQLTAADIDSNFSVARVYSIDGNYTYDFNANATATVNFFGYSNQLIFELGYKDVAATKINRFISFNLILEDQNIGVCAPFFQQFYQQRIVSNQSRQVVLKNDVANCYDLVGTLVYAYDVGYAQTLYTINRPYYLYFYSGGVKTLLSLLDGSQAAQYNIDTIIFSKQPFTLTVNGDGLAFNPLLNSVTHNYDTSTIQIYYKNNLGLNTKTRFDIYADTNLVWSYEENVVPNEFLINFYWGGVSGVTVDTNFSITVVSTTSTGSSSSTTWFDIFGYLIPAPAIIASGTVSKLHIFTAILSVLIFFFGITIVATNRVFGFWGILMCILALVITTFGGAVWQVWYVQLLDAVYISILFFILLLGKQGGGSSYLG